MSYLLDVNILIALIDEGHVHHQFAKNWFLKKHKEGWSTCPITENGLLRIVSNPRYELEIESLRIIADFLKILKRNYSGFSFIPDDYSMVGETIELENVISHKHITDAYLLGLAYRNKMKLATIDSKIKTYFLKEKDADVIELI